MSKDTSDLNVRGLIFPGSFTTSEIVSINGSPSNNGAILWNSTLSRLEVGIGSNFVPLNVTGPSAIGLSDIVATTANNGAVLRYDLATNKYVADTKVSINTGTDAIKSIDNTGSDWLNWQIGTLGPSLITLKKSLGTIATPAAVTNNVKIGSLDFFADNGTSETSANLEISAYTLGNQTGTNRGSKFSLDVTPLNSIIKKTILETSNLGEPVIKDYISSRNDGTAINALYTDTAGVLKHGPIRYFNSVTFNSNSILGLNFIPIEGRLYRINLNPNIMITPDVGSIFSVFNYNLRSYIIQAANATYTQGNYFACYDVERFGNIYYIKETTIPRQSIIKIANNTSTDVAINYNTTTFAPIRLSTNVLSSNNINNNITINANSDTFTTNYNGYIELSYSLNFFCNTNNTSIHLQIINTTTAAKELSGSARILTGNGNNSVAVKNRSILPCAPGNTFQIQSQRLGTGNASVTLSNVIQSYITANTYIL